MFNKFSKTVLRSKFTFEIDFNILMEAFEKAIILRPLHAEVRLEEGESDVMEEQRREHSGGNPPLDQMISQ